MSETKINRRQTTNSPAVDEESGVLFIPVDRIRPNRAQPRNRFDTNTMIRLADSVRRYGILQPLTVRIPPRQSSDDDVVITHAPVYELIAGERRLRAARLAGLAEVPCILMKADNRKAAILGLVENVQRADLNPFEEAEAIRRLMNEWGATQLEVAERLGKAQSTIANKLRLLRLSADQRARILAANLTERHARALLRLETESERTDALNAMIAEQMTAPDAERYVTELLNPPEEAAQIIRVPLIRDVRIFINTLSKAVESIRRSGLDAKSAETETDEYIQYTVFIPKI